MQELGNLLTARPRQALQRLADLALELCSAHSAGISLVEEDGGPCGTVLDRRYEVERAPDGVRALKQQRSRPADVLITDIFMPEQDGLETIAGFRREFPQVKIIAISGGGVRAKGEYLETAQIAGADAAPRKPFDIKVLLQALQPLAPAKQS